MMNVSVWTRCFCIRNLTRSLLSLVPFLIRQQLVRKYRTPALSMKCSLSVSPQMWCIKIIKGWFTPPDLLAKICKVSLSNAKKIRLICFPRICFRGLIYCDLECDRRYLLFFGCTYKVINSNVRCFTLK